MHDLLEHVTFDFSLLRNFLLHIIVHTSKTPSNKAGHHKCFLLDFSFFQNFGCHVTIQQYLVLTKDLNSSLFSN